MAEGWRGGYAVDIHGNGEHGGRGTGRGLLESGETRLAE